MHRLAVFIFIIAIFPVSAQEPNRPGVGYKVVYTPLDFFGEVSCVVSKKKFQTSAFLGLGITRTFFQQRLFPELGLQCAYITSDKPFRVLPYAQLSVSRLKITDASAHYWLNSELGIRFELHRKHDVGIQLGYRNMFEFWNYMKDGLYTSGFGFSGGFYFKL